MKPEHMIQAVRLDKIDQNENSRVIYKEADLQDLMASMRRNGLLQAVGLRKMPGGRFDAIFGNRRILAAKKLDWDSIDAVIFDVESETDRDILGLIENLKRRQTTAAEEGRMYAVIQDRGLTPAEIAARLDVTLQRVETALDVVANVPKEYHTKIVNRFNGTKKPGTISASAYHSIAQLRKREGLNKPQVKELLDFASKQDISVEHIQKVAPLLKEGLNLETAIDKIKDLERINIHIFMPKNTVAKLEKKYERRIGQILFDKLEADSELKVQRLAKPAQQYHPMKSVEDRKKEAQKRIFESLDRAREELEAKKRAGAKAEARA